MKLCKYILFIHWVLLYIVVAAALRFVEIMHLRNSASKLAVKITQTAIKGKEMLYKTSRSNNSSPMKNLKIQIF